MVRTRNGRGRASNGDKLRFLRDGVRRSLNHAIPHLSASNVHPEADDTRSENGTDDLKIRELQDAVHDLRNRQTHQDTANIERDQHVARIDKLCKDLQAWQLKTDQSLGTMLDHVNRNSDGLENLNVDIDITNHRVSDIEKKNEDFDQRTISNSCAIDSLVTANTTLQTSLQANVTNLTSMITWRDINTARDKYIAISDPQQQNFT